LSSQKNEQLNTINFQKALTPSAQLGQVAEAVAAVAAVIAVAAVAAVAATANIKPTMTQLLIFMLKVESSYNN